MTAVWSVLALAAIVAAGLVGPAGTAFIVLGGEVAAYCLAVVDCGGEQR